ncbi:unnamed protein product [Adineta steineri]|uniref:ubiquitinyl hydrolase 1 n=1 Tax=Adineta steineri TaxID=433720 RepID=A0A814RZ96_9BILA|nr:unnamed protein product [Adineta steineri]CAF3912290.1 unnamed protein product [Adineta steineri]
MDSNSTNILENIITRVLHSNYLSNCSFTVVIICLLLLLLTAKVCIPRSCGSLLTSSVYNAQTPFRAPALWPKIHQTPVSIDPERLYNNAILDETANDTPLFISICTSPSSSPAQSHNTIDTTETSDWLSKLSQQLVENITQYQEQIESGGCGLENFGNSCYVNSALQCLCHIRPFISIILNLQQQQQYQLPLITSAYAQLLTKIQSISKGSTNAYELKALVSNLNPRFSGTDEQDSHEFLTTFLEALHDELMDNYQDSSIGDLMHGVIKSTIRCLICEEDTYTDDSFLTLPLPVRRSNPGVFSSALLFTIASHIFCQ